MSTPPPKGWSKLQALVLAEIKAYDRSALRHTSQIKITTVCGEEIYESHDSLYVKAHEAEDTKPVSEIQSIQAARLKRRQLQGKDKLPCKVAPGLYIGAIGAARNLKALRKRGITHVVNASPIVPCYFRDTPSPGTLHYHCVPIYDDESADLLSYIHQTVEFIAEGRRKGAVLVHCFAGQSRSAALIAAYLMSREHMNLEAALDMVSIARQDARPNHGFLEQLAIYETSLCNVR